ncbi:MAG TPA: hypothetical protein DCS07_09455 [Bdellovibrionales bacterium]|nr:MAG: hypothetical protein A2X97_03235 [Bdellovibrionales bacterium GWA1_52_35]OFZ40646.1 MAG: hypothetical protein A2070_06245 [Bdellovibrionales bacterium GWC1_52_8]HAR42837.1 hypothetical protein [Bdellovibrionales bacterium]HCM40371.1 hypothetical protein [Bdellovibrionales bacterium]
MECKIGCLSSAKCFRDFGSALFGAALLLFVCPAFAVDSIPGGQTVLGPLVPELSETEESTNGPLELGMKFQSFKPGQIRAIRYFKALGETGSHTGRIWSYSGEELARVEFENETVADWQIQPLPEPLTISSNTPYVVSVTANTHFASSSYDLETAVGRGDLVSVAGANGVEGSPGSFPATASIRNDNYFRDVIFVADVTLPTVSITSPTSGATAVGTVTVAVNAADDVAISRVDFYVGGVLKASDTTAPYAFSWDSGVHLNAIYTLAVQAFDSSGNAASDSITQVVNRKPKPPTNLR